MNSLIKNVKRLFNEWIESYENELLNKHRHTTELK
jgi:hypothetical protein